MNRHGSAYSGAGSVSVHSYLKPMTSSRHLTEKLYQAAAFISQHWEIQAGRRRLVPCMHSGCRQQRHKEENR